MAFQQEISTMNATEYKKYHESFMQNNHGSSAAHVFFCIFFTVQCSVYSSLRLRNCKTYQLFYEYIIIILPLILGNTVLSGYIYFLNITVMIILFFEIIGKHPRIKKQIECNPFRKKKLYSISIMRGLTYKITVFAILAVDFRDFPRYLAKTERYGYSLMDTGVGLFVLMSGLVHKDLKKHSLINIIKSNVKFISVLVFLGTARYLSVKQLDYQEHVTEYGVHWNFYYTLAVCKLLATVILYYDVNAILYSLIILIIHEGVLILGVQEWVFSNTGRDTLLSANREGVSSCLGYVSMYLFAAHMKSVLSSNSAPLVIKLSKSILLHVQQVQIQLFLGSVFLWTLLYILNTFRPISRTLANASYCVYLEAILVTVIAMLHFVESIVQDEKYLQDPKIIQDVNSNGLTYFLVANLLTGAVNLSMRTLLVSNTTTFIILNVYMILAISITVFLRKKGIKI